jgi:hypothetical protein
MLLTAWMMSTKWFVGRSPGQKIAAPSSKKPSIRRAWTKGLSAAAVPVALATPALSTCLNMVVTNADPS